MEAEIQNYLNGLCCGTTAPVTTYNFDVESSDWAGAGITDKASFESVLGVTTDQFLLSGNKIQANIIFSTSNSLNFTYFDVTNVNYITAPIEVINFNACENININNLLFPFPDTLKTLSMGSCNLDEFKTNQQLPITLRELNLTLNNFNSPLWEDSILNWATFQNQFDKMGGFFGLIINFLNGYNNLYSSSSPIGTMFTSKNITEYYF